MKKWVRRIIVTAVLLVASVSIILFGYNKLYNDKQPEGDIIVKEKTAFIYCLPQIAEYICKELTKVKHTNVKCKIVETDIPALKPAMIEETFPVASLRLDVILAALLKCSRKEALALFENKQVTLNGHVTGRNSISLNNGDIFSVRGHGKFIFDHAGGNTRKGKVYVHIQRYV